MKKQIIRIDKEDGSETVEPDAARVHRTINAEFPRSEQEKVFAAFLAGERKIENDFAYYEVRGGKED